jgi:hypothetical protein
MFDNDIETLENASEKIDSLEKKYDKNISLDSKINIFNNPSEVVRETNQIKKAEKRMVTRIKKIAVLNELERSKAEGLKGRLEFISHYLTLETSYEKAMEIYHNISKFFNEPFANTGNLKYVFIPILTTQILVNIVITAAYIPVALGIIGAITGYRGIQLLKYISENNEIKNTLEQAGLYQKIVEFVKKQNNYSSDFRYGDSYEEHLREETYKDFISEEFDYKRR